MSDDSSRYTKWFANSGTLVFGGIALFILATQCFTIIDPGYRGVSVTLGNVDPHFRSEGMTFKLPLVEKIVKVPVKQLTVPGEAPCFSSDLQTVNISFKALYRIPEDRVVELYRQYQGDPYTTLVEPRIQDALKQVTARYRAEDLVKNRERVKQEALSIIRNTLQRGDEAKASAKDRSPLVWLADLPLSNIDLSAELEQAIEQKQITEQQALAKNYELEKAKKEAEIVQVQAEAEARAVRIKGDALKSSPEVVELEIAKKWDGKAPSTVVVGKGGGNVLLPLR